ncbi:LysE/ArgO family amino acid transporter [Vibrio nomapromontoriensis]|uniref:LysE/ArgO family amino acid transporter n=1 Tax=Vibrio nomapromontoriensis TaxID=2910246 RepID=UPI003D111DAE
MLPINLDVFVTGFSLSISLILAIGAQNAFVLKQGLKKHHVFFVCLVCAVSDALLISAGVGGFGVLIQAYPSVEVIARYAGALFLFVYSFQSFRSAFTVQHKLDPEGESKGSLLKTIGICLALTWLNPHVYLDTVVLLGSISTQYAPQQWSFGIGAVSASFIFFFSLGYGARLLIPLFSKPMSWKVLEGLVGTLMFFIALTLVIG